MAEHQGFDTLWLSGLLKNFHESAKPADVIRISSKPAVAKGENYLSTIYRVELLCQLSSSKRKTFSMIVKKEIPREVNPFEAQSTVFRLEIMTYTTALSVMEGLMEEFGDKRELLWPQCYGYQPYTLVAFEDLAEKQYVVAPRRDCLDLDHTKLVLRNLARFHAMSKVLLARGLICEDNKGHFGIISKDEGMKKFWHALLSMLSDGMATTWGKEWKDIAKRIDNQREVICEKLNNLGTTYDKRFEVYSHGDLWTCNMMFQYLEYEKKPVSVKFLDFQGCHINSFIWDVDSFLNTSVVPSVRREHKSMLHACYQEALEYNLKRFNFTGYIPTLDDVNAESKRIKYAHFAMSLTNPIICAETTNALNVDKIMTHPPNEIVDPSVYSDGKAQRLLGDDYKYYAECDVI